MGVDLGMGAKARAMRTLRARRTERAGRVRQWMRGARHAAAGVMVAMAVGACGTSAEVEYEERPVDTLYNEAMDALEAGEPGKAAELFDEVERQHPYSPWATRAQVLSAYSYYEGNQYDEAVAALDRYIRLHPANPDVPYAHYLKGTAFYERVTDVERDQSMTLEARKAFEQLVARYPTSPYARDARLKLDLINDHLAGKEMSVGRFYLRQGHQLAAINRFRRVVEDYQTTMHVPEALHRLAEAYTVLGLDNEARRMAAILGHNYPDSDWYIDAYELVENRSVRVREEPWYKFW
jgi:outer membrane protein assembly factor BamD